MIVLTPLRKFQFPVMAECISPDVFQGKSRDEIASLTVYEGNRRKKLGNLFKIEKESAENLKITIKGDVNEVRRIGSGMKSGEIMVFGNVGMHLGHKMEGGKITVHGDVDGWAGSEMKGGLIEIQGNAGNYLASPYRGSSVGMRGGKIVVSGNIGTDSGASMQKGVIKIHGKAGHFLGFRMRGGVIHVEKDVGDRAGACMTGGKIVVSGSLESILPTFTIDKMKPKVKIDQNEKVTGPFYVFLGDRSENGKGKLFASKAANPQLSSFEKLL